MFAMIFDNIDTVFVACHVHPYAMFVSSEFQYGSENDRIWEVITWSVTVTCKLLAVLFWWHWPSGIAQSLQQLATGLASLTTGPLVESMG